MHQSHCIQNMQIDSPEEILFCLNPLVIVQVGDNDAARARRDIVEPASNIGFDAG
jgi:hypothetical protein